MARSQWPALLPPPPKPPNRRLANKNLLLPLNQTFHLPLPCADATQRHFSRSFPLCFNCNPIAISVSCRSGEFSEKSCTQKGRVFVAASPGAARGRSVWMEIELVVVDIDASAFLDGRSSTLRFGLRGALFGRRFGGEHARRFGGQHRVLFQIAIGGRQRAAAVRRRHITKHTTLNMDGRSQNTPTKPQHNLHW